MSTITNFQSHGKQPFSLFLLARCFMISRGFFISWCTPFLHFQSINLATSSSISSVISSRIKVLSWGKEVRRCPNRKSLIMIFDRRLVVNLLGMCRLDVTLSTMINLHRRFLRFLFLFLTRCFLISFLPLFLQSPFLELFR